MKFIGRSCANDNDCLIDLDDSYCNLNTRTCERNLVESMKCYNGEFLTV